MSGRTHVDKAFEKLVALDVLNVFPRFQREHIVSADDWHLAIHLPIAELADGELPKKKLDDLAYMVSQVACFMQEDDGTQAVIFESLKTSTWFPDEQWIEYDVFRISGRVRHLNGTLHNVQVTVKDIYSFEVVTGHLLALHYFDLSITTTRDPLSGEESSRLSSSGDSSSSSSGDSSSPSPSHNSTATSPSSSSSPPPPSSSSTTEHPRNVDADPEQLEQEVRPEENEADELVAVPAIPSPPTQSPGLAASLEEEDTVHVEQDQPRVSPEQPEETQPEENVTEELVAAPVVQPSTANGSVARLEEGSRAPGPSSVCRLCRSSMPIVPTSSATTFAGRRSAPAVPGSLNSSPPLIDITHDSPPSSPSRPVDEFSSIPSTSEAGPSTSTSTTTTAATTTTTAPISRRRPREAVPGEAEGATGRKKTCHMFVVVNVTRGSSIDEMLRELSVRPSAPPQRHTLPLRTNNDFQHNSFYSFSVDNRIDATKIEQLVEQQNWADSLNIVRMESNTYWSHMDVLGVLKAILLATFYSHTGERPPSDVHQAIGSRTLVKQALENEVVKRLMEGSLTRKGLDNLEKIHDWANK